MQCRFILALLGWVCVLTIVVDRESLHSTAAEPSPSFSGDGPSPHSGRTVRGNDHEGNQMRSKGDVHLGRHEGNPYPVRRSDPTPMTEETFLRRTQLHTSQEGDGFPSPLREMAPPSFPSFNHSRNRRQTSSLKNEDYNTDLFQLVSEDGLFVSVKGLTWSNQRFMLQCSRVRGPLEMFFFKVGNINAEKNGFDFFNEGEVTLQSTDAAGMSRDPFQHLIKLEGTQVPHHYKIYLVGLDGQRFQRPTFCAGTSSSRTVFRLEKLASLTGIQDLTIHRRRKFQGPTLYGQYSMMTCFLGDPYHQLIRGPLLDQYEVTVYGFEANNIRVPLAGLFGWGDPERFDPKVNEVQLGSNSYYLQSFSSPTRDVHFRFEGRVPYILDAVITKRDHFLYWKGVVAYDRHGAKRTVYGVVRYVRLGGFGYANGMDDYSAGDGYFTVCSYKSQAKIYGQRA